LNRSSRVALAIFACCLFAQIGAGLFAQAQLTVQAPTSDPDTAVASLIDRILTRGETSRGTVRMSTWVPPTAEDIAEVKRLGTSAIPPLDRAFLAKRSFQRLLVIRLLGEIGGPEIVPTLKRGLDPTLSNSVRLGALYALTTVPNDLALPLIRGNVKDKDPLVAKEAKDLLANRYHAAVDQ
jgi:HEAT repeat protein